VKKVKQLQAGDFAEGLNRRVGESDRAGEDDAHRLIARNGKQIKENFKWRGIKEIGKTSEY